MLPLCEERNMSIIIVLKSYLQIMTTMATIAPLRRNMKANIIDIATFMLSFFLCSPSSTLLLVVESSGPSTFTSGKVVRLDSMEDIQLGPEVWRQFVIYSVDMKLGPEDLMVSLGGELGLNFWEFLFVRESIGVCVLMKEGGEPE